MQPNTCPRLHGLKSIFNASVSFTRKASTNMKLFPGAARSLWKGAEHTTHSSIEFQMVPRLH